MKKTIVSRLWAVALAACMMLSMAAPVSALTTYHLNLTITELESVKPSGTSKVTVTDTSGSVLKSDKLTPHLVSLLVANFEGDAKDNREGLWDFESDQMGRTIEQGLGRPRKSSNDWFAWLDSFAAKGDITGDGSDKGDLVALLKGDKTVNDMGAVGSSYVLYYAPEDAVEGDPAKGNTYTFTLTLTQKTVGGGGGGAAAPAEYAITVSASENASVSVSAKQAAAGDKITVTVTVSEGYVLDDMTIKGASGTKLAVTGYGDGTYTFTMPAEAVSVTVTTKKAPAAGGFIDVPHGSWYEDAVDYVADNDLMSGVGDNMFQPDGPLTRAMVAQIFYNLEGKPSQTYENAFTDVEEDMWYRNSIAWAFANNVVAGYGGGIYRPNKDVTREELVQIFFNYAKAKGWYDGTLADLTTFVDHAEVAPWHTEAVRWGVAAKLISGKGGNQIDPNATGLRAEAAQMLKNLCENIRK